MSTIRNADMIVAVQDGTVAESGTHQELMSKKGVYYQLVMLQTFEEQVKEEEKDNLSLLSNDDRGLFNVFSMSYVPYQLVSIRQTH